MKYFSRPGKIDTKTNFVPMAAGSALLLVGMLAAAPLRAQSGLQVAEAIEQPILLLLHSHSQGFLGVDLGDVDQERVQTLHLKDTRGAEITILDHDAPAGKAGLKLHDVILEVNGEAIESAEQLKQMLHA